MTALLKIRKLYVYIDAALNNVRC